MKFIIAGRSYSIEAITPPMDQAFVNLHAAYFSNQPLHWDTFKGETIKFLNKQYNHHGLTGSYFRNFTIIWKRFLNDGLWNQAEEIWELALEPIIEWESKNTGSRVHKGSAYYFWGMTAIQRGDLDRGYALMHQALQEDVLTSSQQFPTTPAFAFASLDYAKVDQAFRQWVLIEAQFLSQQIADYCNNCGRTFTLDEFKNKYLKKPPSIDAIYLLAYVVARLIRLTSLPPYLLSSPFAGQLLQNILFDLVQVVDITIANKNFTKWKMIDHINFLSRRAGILISKTNLRYANSRFQSDFENTMTEILDGTFIFQGRIVPTLTQRSLLVVYGLRNHGAHNVASSPVMWQRYQEINNSVFETLFLAVELLY